MKGDSRIPAHRRARVGLAGLAVAGLVLAGLVLAGCGADTRSADPGSADPAPAATSAVSSPSPTGGRLSGVPSTMNQPLTTSSFAAGDLVTGTVTRVKPLLVLLSAQGRSGVIRGSAYERVKVGDHVVVKITEPDQNGRFEGILVHVSNKS